MAPPRPHPLAASWHHRLLTTALTLALVPSTAMAGAGWAPAVEAGAPVIASPDLSEEDIRWAITRMRSKEENEALLSAAPLPLDAPAFVDPLRHQMLIDNMAAYRANLQACKGLEGDVTSWLKAASQHALELDAPAAVDAQKKAEAAFECLPDAIGKAGVAALISVPGLISGYSREEVLPLATDETVRLFKDVFVVDSAARLSGDHHADITQAFDAARELSAGGETLTIPLPVDDLPGVALWIDGVVAPGPTVTLAPGRHFAQVVDHRGRAGYGGTFVIHPDPAVAPPHIIPPGLHPPSKAELAKTLSITAVSGALPPPVQKAARASLGAGDHPWLLISVSDPGDGRLIGLLLTPDGTLTHQRFERRRPGCAAANWSTAAFGIAAIAGAAIWAPSYLEKQQAINRGAAWYSEDGNTPSDAALHDQRIMLGMGLGWGAATAGIVTLGAAKAGGCNTKSGR